MSKGPVNLKCHMDRAKSESTCKIFSLPGTGLSNVIFFYVFYGGGKIE